MEAIQVSQGMKMGRRLLLASTAITLVLLGRPAQAQMPPPDTTPQGGTVVGGAASIARAPGAVTITQSSPRAAIDWRSFNVGAKARVTFRQPDARAIALNRVVTDRPSVIAGRIDANGQIVLMNQSGVVFTKGSQVNAESLVVSTSGISARNFMAGHLDFTAPPRPGARIVNRGRITMKQAGLAAFVAPQVVNRGVVTARLGHVILAGASAFTLDLQGDRLISLDVTRAVRRMDLGGRQVDALVTNQGTIIADGGAVTLSARAVDGLIQQLLNVGGTIRADNLGGSAGTITIQGIGGDLRIAGSLLARGRAAGEAGGTIDADASGTVRLTRTARIDASGPAHGGVIALGTEAAKSAPRAEAVTIARGAMVTADATRSGAGGSITVLSREQTVQDGALSAQGIGGAGGRIETSSDGVISISGTESVVALDGKPGEILLDPATLVIAASGDRGASAGIASASGGGTTVTTVGLTTIGTSYVDPAMLGGLSGTVILDAARLISVQSALDMRQASAVTLNSGGDVSVAAQISLAGSLEIDAGGHIAIGAPVIGGAVGLSSRNGVAETDGGLIQTPLLGSAGTIAGGLDLAGPNVIGTIGNIAISSGNATISSTGTMAIAGTLSDPGGLISLSADALDEGETGAIDAGSGSLVLAGSSALLASPFNRFATLAGARLSGSLDLADRAPLLTSGAVSAHDAIFSAAGLIFDAPVSAGTLALASSAGVSQGTGGAIDAETLTSDGGTIAGNALLDEAPNNIGTLSNFTVAGDAMVETSGALRLDGAVDIAGALALGAPGGLTEAGTASLEAATLSGIGSFAGPVSLAGGNDIAALGGFDTGGSLLLRDDTSLEISEPVTASSIALIDAGTLDLASSLSVPTGGSVGLTADSMTDAGGTIMAPAGMVSLAPLSPGRPVVIGGTDPNMLDLSISILQAAGDAATLALGSTDSGPLTVAAPADLAVPDIILRGGGIVLDAALGASGTLDLESTAGITQEAAFSAQSLTGSASGMVSLGMPNLIGTLQSFFVPNQTFLLRDRAELLVSGPVGAENIGLDAASLAISGPLAATSGLTLGSGLGITATGPISATTLMSEGTIGGAASLTGANRIGTLGDFAVAGDLSFVDDEPLLIAGTLDVPDALAMGGAGGITESGAIIAGTLSSIGTIGGAVSLTGANSIGILGGFASQGDLALNDAPAIHIADTLTAPELTLDTGAIDETGAVDTGLLSGAVSGPVLLAGGNSIAALGDFIAQGLFTLNDATPLVVMGRLAAPEVALAAQGITETGGIDAALLESLGPVGGNVSLGGANDIGTLGRFLLPSGVLELNDEAALTLAGPVTARAASISVAGEMLLDGGGLFVGGTAQPFSAAILPSPRRGIDSVLRVTGIRPSLIQNGTFGITPYQAAGNTVFVQLEPDGMARFNNLAAPETELVLDLGSGFASGELALSHLIVLGGSQGRADFTGTLHGLPGAAAAHEGVVLAQPQPGYKFNACIIGSVNCTLLAIAAVPEANPLQSFDLRPARRRRFDRDVRLPGIAARDY